MEAADALLPLACLLATLLFWRLFYIRPLWRSRRLAQRQQRRTIKTMVVLGSGGHTMEMMDLLAAFPLAKYTPRVYVLAETDRTSQAKALVLELEAAQQRALLSKSSSSTAGVATRSKAKLAAAKDVGSEGGADGGAASVQLAKSPQPHPHFWFERIPRSREVGQSYVSTVFSTLYSILYVFPLVLRTRPDLILCNGPGTCVPICFAGAACRILGIHDVKIIYVESICRVQSLSLAAKLLRRFRISDQVVVMWPELAERYRGTHYLGKLL